LKCEENLKELEQDIKRLPQQKSGK
jgi:hypothetical protein